MRVSSPPYRWPCFYGMDTGSRSELLAANMEVHEIRDYLGVDTLSYLSLDRLITATGAPTSGYCTACLTGEYPVEVPVDLSVPVTLTERAGTPERPAELPLGAPVTGGAGS